MKRYFITLALLLLLLTLLIPSSLPTATAAPLNDTDKEYHPGINAKQLKVYQKAVKTADCGDLPPMACTPDGPNDPGDQEKLIHDRIIPGGTTVDEITITNNPPTEHYQYEKCGYPAEQWRETNYDQVDLSLGYPPEYSEQPDTIRGYKQGFKDRITITGLWILPPYHHPDCEKALHGTAIEETNLSGRYTLTDAPHSDSDDIADAYDACPSEPGPASNDGCPEPPYQCRNFEETWNETYTVRNSARRTDEVNFSTGRVFLQVCYNGESAYLEGYETSFDLSNDASGRGFRPLRSNYETFIIPENSSGDDPTNSSIRIVFRPYYALPNADLTSIGVTVLGVGMNAGWSDNGAEVRYTEYAINVDTEGCYIHSGGGSQKSCPHGRYQ